MNLSIKTAINKRALFGFLSFITLVIMGCGDSDKATNELTAKTKEPLYWVAPMDPNYKRDKPGKSPMGMDLIPVYPDEAAGEEVGPGAISISAQVIQNLGVRIEQVVRQSIHSEITTVGYVRYDEDKLIHIHPRTDGWIEKLYVKSSGDPVSKGQPLYEIYSPTLVNAQEELLLAQDRNNPRLLRAAEERLVALQFPKNSIETLKKRKSVNQTVTFNSPIDGVVDDLSIREGFFVKPDKNLMVIGSLDEIWVEAEIFERQASQVEVGNAVSMTLDYLPGRKWQGEVDYVYPMLDPKTRTIKVRLRFKNGDRALKPNMFAQVLIQGKGSSSALLVPRESVIRTGSMDRVVLALGEGRFKSVEVTLGHVGEKWIEILKGLKEGESVVTSAQFLIDSESSISSDFKRMDFDQDNKSNADKSAEVGGIINSLMLEHRMLNISREAIPKWNRDKATLDFVVADGLDISSFKVGANVYFTFEIKNGQFLITKIHEVTADTHNMNTQLETGK